MTEKQYWYHKRNYFCKNYDCERNCPMRQGALCMYPELYGDVND